MGKDRDISIDFKNADEAIGYFKAEIKEDAEPVCVATIIVRFSAFKSIAVRDALIEFVKKLFGDLTPLYEGTAKETRMYFYDREADNSDRINVLLDRCVTLNTYFKHYFYPKGDVSFFCIYMGVHGDTDKLTSLCFSNHYDAAEDFLDINEIVRLNSKAGERLKKAKRIGVDAAGEYVYDYDVEDGELARALDKKAR